MRVVVLAGGYGGAKMAQGFALLGEEVELSVVGNTADDLQLHGLHISPDLDTVMYTLAGLANVDTGWGVRDETWSAAGMLQRYGAETWFQLGDRDLATHIRRTSLLGQGLSLTQVTARLCAALDVAARLLPMSDDRVATKVRTAQGWLDFQDYFVRRQQRDTVLELRFDGVEQARPTADVLRDIDRAEVVIVAPSNPFVSIGPILALPGLLQRLLDSSAPVLAVSPIVAGAALRGPAAQMLRSLGDGASSVGVARLYAERYPGLVDLLVVDEADAPESAAINGAGLTPILGRTVMRNEKDRGRLAAELLEAVGLRAR